MANAFLKPIEQLVSRQVRCNCKKTHRTGLKKVVIEQNAIERLPQLLSEYADRRVFLVSDKNTQLAAGDRVLTVLGSMGFHIGAYIFQTDVQPSQADLGKLMLEVHGDVDALVAVGSGALQDLLKYYSVRTGIPLISIPTAASTDSYAMPFSVFFENGKKRVFRSAVPVMIVVDLNVIAAAPKQMAPAGAAAVLSKHISLFDWRLSKLVDETPYCADLARAMLHCIQTFTDSLSGSRPLYSMNTLESLVRALLFAGVLVSYAESIYPAVGSETLISDCIFMTGMFDRADIPSEQFIKAVATANCARITESIIAARPNFNMAKMLLDDYGWVMHNNEINRIYKEDAPEVLSRSGGFARYNKEMHQRRLFYLNDRWNSIVSAARDMIPEYTALRETLRNCVLPYRFEDLGMTRGQAQDAIIWSAELTEHYNLLSLIWEVGEIDSVAGALTSRMRD
ncbi:MAG: iron-containing alcohol dehydrogenase [Oscillospiraceae bacterium]|nr:iron-containing alcohol dehydrogenase [Oscillospiraceae bacterium]